MPALLAQLDERAPGVKVLMLTVHDESTVAGAAMAAGVQALVLKSCLATDLLPAVDALLAGQRYVSPRISRGKEPQL